jgi:D-methionine transport system substrate-binding protein
MKRRQLLQFAAALSLAAGFAAAPAWAQAKTYKIGVTAGPHAKIMDFVKGVAAKEGLKLDVVVFSDYVQPNAALAAGDLDANSYQHVPYLKAQMKDRGYKFSVAGYTVTFPMGVYSRKVKSLGDLPDGARVGVPNDPTNEGRALLLLQSKGVFTLRKDAGLKATPLDIVENPKNVKIVELDAAQLPRALSDLSAAVINGNYAASAGLNPVDDAIAMEGPKGPYANVLVVRTEDKNKPWVAKLVKAYHSQETRKFIEDSFNNSVIVSW